MLHQQLTQPKRCVTSLTTGAGGAKNESSFLLKMEQETEKVNLNSLCNTNADTANVGADDYKAANERQASSLSPPRSSLFVMGGASKDLNINSSRANDSAAG